MTPPERVDSGSAIDQDMDPIIRRLSELEQGSPDLRDAAQLYKAILPLLRDTDLHVKAVSHGPDQVREKMEQDLPVLDGIELELEEQAVCNLMARLAGAVEKSRAGNPHRAEDARRVKEAVENKNLDIPSLLPYVAAGERGPVRSAAISLQLDPDLVWILAQNALKPALREWCRQLALPADDIKWDKGICFVCGASATLAELQGNNQAKHLRCGQCGADWPFRRLQCMYCGNEDHNTIGCLYMESQREKMHVEVCDKCHGYLKVIAAYSPTPAEMLPVEDLATLHLDFIAQERGYNRIEVNQQPI
jgi:FdhE protein